MRSLRAEERPPQHALAMVPLPFVLALDISRLIDADEAEIRSAGAKHCPGANSPLAGALRWLAGRNKKLELNSEQDSTNSPKLAWTPRRMLSGLLFPGATPRDTLRPTVSTHSRRNEVEQDNYTHGPKIDDVPQSRCLRHGAFGCSSCVEVTTPLATPREASLVLRKRFLHASMVSRRHSTDSSPPRPHSTHTLAWPAGNTSPVARRLQLSPSLRVGSSEDGTRQGRSSPCRSVSWDSDIEEACLLPEWKQDAPHLQPTGYGLQPDSPLAARLTSSPHDSPLASPPHDDNVRQRRRRLAMEKLAMENGFSVERKRARARRIEERQ